MFNFTNQATEQKAQPVFTDTRAKWKALAADRKLTKEDIAARCIYRSMLRGEGIDGAKTRLRKSFFPITNTVKLENGAAPYGALTNALWLIRHSTFSTWLTADERTAMLEIATQLRAGEIK